MIGTARGWTAFWVLAVGLGTHALLPYFPFPRPSDFALAPLAEAWADPALYPRDYQIRGFDPLPWAYVLPYWLAKSTIGVAAAFWLVTVLLTVAAVGAIHSVMRRLGAAGLALPLAVAVGLMVARPGIGSGEEVGLANGHFQHEWLALVPVFWAFAATLARRPGLAGLALGAAAYALPVIALHGAVAVACACFAQGRPGLAALARTALTAVPVALPAAYVTIAAAPPLPAEAVPTARLIADGYLFTAPESFRIGWRDLLLGWGHLGLGLAALPLLRPGRAAEATMALGLLAGLAALHLAATLLYSGDPPGFLAAYRLDATRSSPLAFALAAALFAAAAERQAADSLADRRRLLPLLPAAVLAATLMVTNALAPGWFFLLAGLLVLATPGRAVPRLALAATLALVFAVMTPRIVLRAQVAAAPLHLYEWAAQETAPEALFIIPPGMEDFRLFARRSVYADFALLAAAGPERAWFARTRLERIAPPSDQARGAGGREAMTLWDRSYLIAATCSGIVALLRDTGADYFVRPVRSSGNGGDEQDSCGGNPAVAFANRSFTVYARDPRKASGN